MLTPAIRFGLVATIYFIARGDWCSPEYSGRPGRGGEPVPRSGVSGHCGQSAVPATSPRAIARMKLEVAQRWLAPDA